MPLERVRRWWNPVYEPIAFYEPMRSEILERLRANDAIGAMKIANRRTGIGIRATKRSVDHLAQNEGLSSKL
jgi:hypothetical protein